jgi:hypothetical protein
MRHHCPRIAVFRSWRVSEKEKLWNKKWWK